MEDKYESNSQMEYNDSVPGDKGRQGVNGMEPRHSKHLLGIEMIVSNHSFHAHYAIRDDMELHNKISLSNRLASHSITDS